MARTYLEPGTTGQAVVSSNYSTYSRPVQSPDGTKIEFTTPVFHDYSIDWNETSSRWELNSGSIESTAYVVAYYPYPPEIISTANGVVRFDWRTDQTTSRGYTQRGWPDESTDDPPPPRETEKFRLWKQASCTGDWSPVTTVDADIFDKYDFAEGTWSGNKYWDITDPSPSGSDCYTVTSVEWSGLESRIKSNVFSDATDAQTVAYPADPGADTGIISSYDSDLVRYYNIYADDGTTPTITQTMRVASIPVSSGTSWIDWLGNTDGTTQYVVTAVDTQGNESTALTSSATHKQSPATADGQYTLSWTSEVSVARFNQGTGSVSFGQSGTVNFNQ